MANFNKNSKNAMRKMLLNNSNVKPRVFAYTGQDSVKPKKTLAQCLAERKQQMKHI